MARQTLQLGTPTFLANGAVLEFDPADIQIDSALVPSGTTRWALRFRVFRSTHGIESFRGATDFRFGATSGEDISFIGQDLSVAAETGTWTFEYGSSSIEIPGPDNPNATTQDSGDHYQYKPDADDTFDPLFTYFTNNPSATATLTIDDGQPIAQSFQLGPRNTPSGTNVRTWEPLNLRVTEDDFRAASSGQMWLHKVELDGSSNRIRLEFSVAEGGWNGRGTAGPHLSDDFETDGMLLFRVGSTTYALPAPRGSNVSSTDGTEPYSYVVSGSAATTLDNLVAAATSGTNVSLTLWDGEDTQPTPPAPTAVTNAAPNVNITTTAQTIDPGGTVSLAGTATDPDGGSVTVQWSSADGGSFTNPTQTSAQWTAPYRASQQTYTLRLTATDLPGAQGSDTVNITVRAATIVDRDANDIDFNFAVSDADSTSTIFIPTEQEFDLGTPETLSSDTLQFGFNNSLMGHRIDAGLVEGGGAAYLKVVRFVTGTSSIGAIVTTHDTDSSATGLSDGPELVSRWENFASAIELIGPNGSITLPGPALWDVADTTEYYAGRLPASDRTALGTWLAAHSSSDSIRLVLRDGQLPTIREDANDIDFAFTLSDATGEEYVPEILQATFDTQATFLRTFFGPSVDIEGGAWQRDSGGSTGSGGTGPGTNNTLAFMHTETSGSGGLTVEQVEERGIAQFRYVPPGVRRQLILRTCIAGQFSADTGGREGLAVQHRASDSDSWADAGFLYGYTYSNSRTTGQTLTDDNGTTHPIVANGGWIDVTVDIPDSATQVRLHPAYTVIAGDSSEDDIYRHDIALRSMRWTGPTVITADADDIDFEFTISAATGSVRKQVIIAGRSGVPTTAVVVSRAASAQRLVTIASPSGVPTTAITLSGTTAPVKAATIATQSGAPTTAAILSRTASARHELDLVSRSGVPTSTVRVTRTVPGQRVVVVDSRSGVPTTTLAVTRTAAGVRTAALASRSGVPITALTLSRTASARHEIALAGRSGVPTTAATLTRTAAGVRMAALASRSGVPTTAVTVSRTASVRREIAIASQSGVPTTSVAFVRRPRVGGAVFTTSSVFTDAFPDASFSGEGGRWQHKTSGSSQSNNTGPSRNTNTLPFVHTETSGTAAEDTADDVESRGIVEFGTLPLGVDRVLSLRLSIQGEFSQGQEGVHVQYRDTVTDAWTDAQFIYGWDYAANYSAGGTVTDSNGVEQTFAANGGWVDYDVDIPDSATQVRLRPSYVYGAGSRWNHDIAWQSFQWSTAADAQAIGFAFTTGAAGSGILRTAAIASRSGVPTTEVVVTRVAAGMKMLTAASQSGVPTTALALSRMASVRHEMVFASRSGVPTTMLAVTRTAAGVRTATLASRSGVPTTALTLSRTASARHEIALAGQSGVPTTAVTLSRIAQGQKLVAIAGRSGVPTTVLTLSSTAASIKAVVFASTTGVPTTALTVTRTAASQKTFAIASVVGAPTTVLTVTRTAAGTRQVVIDSRSGTPSSEIVVTRTASARHEIALASASGVPTTVLTATRRVPDIYEVAIDSRSGAPTTSLRVRSIAVGIKAPRIMSRSAAPTTDVIVTRTAAEQKLVAIDGQSGVPTTTLRVRIARSAIVHSVTGNVVTGVPTVSGAVADITLASGRLAQLHSESGSIQSAAVVVSGVLTKRGRDSVAAPTNLQATAGDASVTLSWDSGGSESHIEVRAFGPGSTDFATIATLPSSARRYVDIGLINEQQYRYQLRVGSPGDYETSNEVAVTPEAVTEITPIAVRSVQWGVVLRVEPDGGYASNLAANDPDPALHGFVTTAKPTITPEFELTAERGQGPGTGGQIAPSTPAGLTASTELEFQVIGAGEAYTDTVRPPVDALLRAAGLKATVDAGTVTYTPTIIASELESCSLDAYDRQQLHRLRGNFVSALGFGFEGSIVPDWTASMSGILLASEGMTDIPQRAALPDIVYPATDIIPPIAGDIGMTIDGDSTPIVKSCTFNFDREVASRLADNRVRHLGFTPGTRTVGIELTVEMSDLSDFNPFQYRRTAQRFAFSFRVGRQQYNRWWFRAPMAVITDAVRSEDGPVALWDLSIGLYPTGYNVSDDFEIVFD